MAKLSLPRWLRIVFGIVAILVIAILVLVAAEFPRPIPLDPLMRDWTPGCPEWPTHWRGTNTEALAALQGIGPDYWEGGVEWISHPRGLAATTALYKPAADGNGRGDRRLFALTDNGATLADPLGVGYPQTFLRSPTGVWLLVTRQIPFSRVWKHVALPELTITEGSPLPPDLDQHLLTDERALCFSLVTLPDGQDLLAFGDYIGNRFHVTALVRYDPTTGVAGPPLTTDFFLWRQVAFVRDATTLEVRIETPLGAPERATLSLFDGTVTSLGPAPAPPDARAFPTTLVTHPHIQTRGQPLGNIEAPSLSILREIQYPDGDRWYELPLGIRSEITSTIIRTQPRTHWETHAIGDMPMTRGPLWLVPWTTGTLAPVPWSPDTKRLGEAVAPWLDTEGLRFFALEGARVLVTQVVYPVPSLTDDGLAGVIRFGLLADPWLEPTWIGHVRLPADFPSYRTYPRVQCFLAGDQLRLTLTSQGISPAHDSAVRGYWATEVPLPAGWPHGLWAEFGQSPLWAAPGDTPP